jgi:hypothetical protein
MAWIESHQDLGRHPKTKKLARALNIPLPLAIGHLFYLWWWALDYAEDGVLTRYSDEDIADASEWGGDASDFVNALVKSGFVDVEDEKKTIHDWWDYAGKLIDRRKKDRERKQTSKGNPTENTRKQNGNSTASIRTEQNTTEQNRTEPEEATASSAAHAASAAVPVRSDPVPYQKIQEVFNSTCVRLPKIKSISGERQKAVSARFKTYGFDGLVEVFQKAAISEFLNGNVPGKREWKADFDWLMNVTNIVKVLEGKYDNKNFNATSEQEKPPWETFVPSPKDGEWEVPPDYDGYGDMLRERELHKGGSG